MAAKDHVKILLDNTAKFFASLEELTSKSVFVGVPSTRIQRDPEPGEKTTPNNAVIGYVQENGDPDKNIPPRPFLIPGVTAIQPEVVKRLRGISEAAMLSDLSRVQALRTQLGIVAQRAVQAKITDGPFQPLAEATLQARARRKFGKGAAGARKGAKIELQRRAAGLAAGTDFARPLIDTGQLRRAINYVIGPTRNRKKTIQAMVGAWPTFNSQLAQAKEPTP
jgi:hypothetical protein